MIVRTPVLLAAAVLTLAASEGSTQAPDYSRATAVDIVLKSFSFPNTGDCKSRQLREDHDRR